MNDNARAVPERLALLAGDLPAPGTLPQAYPFETLAPQLEGYVERDGVRSWYAQFGDSGPWLAFAPIFQIGNSHMLKGVVPYLAQHFRVVVMDLRGNGNSPSPAWCRARGCRPSAAAVGRSACDASSALHDEHQAANRGRLSAFLTGVSSRSNI